MITIIIVKIQEKKKLIINNECHNNKKYNNIHKKIINFSGFHLLDY